MINVDRFAKAEPADLIRFGIALREELVTWNAPARILQKADEMLAMQTHTPIAGASMLSDLVCAFRIHAAGIKAQEEYTARCQWINAKVDEAVRAAHVAHAERVESAYLDDAFPKRITHYLGS